ncbi:MAG TPA: FecR family protein [Puia sp.]|nr:FecR family protein [Puia sp.]
MNLSPERLDYLLERYAANRCTPQELLELMEAMQQDGGEEIIHRRLERIWREGAEVDEGSLPDRERIFNAITGDASVVPASGRRSLWRWVPAAAAVIVLLCGAGYWYARSMRGVPPGEAGGAAPVVKKDIAPAGNKAILTLSDGTDVVLDSAPDGAVSRQGGSMVMKKGGGELAYQAAANAERRALSEPVYNKITTPRGGKYMVVLPDGSKVWLNAASVLRFPTTFTGSDRTVELWGEAYFEIEKDKSKPFYVKANHMQVSVLGTSFNIMAYEEEGVVRTTLLDGAVQVMGPSGSSLRLSPGQEVRCGKDGALQLVKDALPEESVAWKNDLFYFRGADIQSIMRQLARWYDIDVAYAGAVNGKFYAKIPRNTNLSIVLRALALTNKLNFTQEGKKVTVIP